ncbi:MAG TPA: hypothetical protein VE996_15180 [Terriglobales bacterium]|jgi:hypothetical protein|nr:hypothetical protein [Terriglobales bacterium]
MSAFLQAIGQLGQALGTAKLRGQLASRQAQAEQFRRQLALRQLQLQQQELAGRQADAQQTGDLRAEQARLTAAYRQAQQQALARYRQGQLTVEQLRAQLSALQVELGAQQRLAAAKYNAARLAETTRHDKAMEAAVSARAAGTSPAARAKAAHLAAAQQSFQFAFDAARKALAGKGSFGHFGRQTPADRQALAKLAGAAYRLGANLGMSAGVLRTYVDALQPGVLTPSSGVLGAMDRLQEFLQSATPPADADQLGGQLFPRG